MTPNLEAREHVGVTTTWISSDPTDSYARTVAERFGYDARIRIICALDPDRRIDQPIIDKHIESVYRFARIAFHYASECVSPARRMEYMRNDPYVSLNQ